MENTGNIGIGILNTFPKVFSTVTGFISNALVDTFSSFYTSKVEEKQTNKLVKGFGLVVFVCAIGIIFFTIKENYNQNNTELVQIDKDKSKKIEKKQEKKKEIEKQVEKKPQKKVEKTQPKKPEPKKEKSPSQVTELVLPNLNIKTETVLSLFEDVEYDLKTVRYQKKVKPIYFTQFPKDLNEIKNTKLKKETFIKIVLPLVVAENEKIFDDRIKKKKISSKKMTTDKEKSWLRLKLREYKVKNSDFKELAKRMDTIPVSIALAQAKKVVGEHQDLDILINGLGRPRIEPLNKGKQEVALEPNFKSVR